MVAGVEVVPGVGLHDPVLVGVARSGLGERGVIQVAVGAFDHLDPVVGGVDDPEPERVAVGDEGVPHPHRHELAVRADADRPLAVVSALDGVAGPAGAVVGSLEVAREVGRVVVVVEEVPAHDVVGIAVVIVVDRLGARAARSAGGETGLGHDRVRRLVDPAVAERVQEVLSGDQRLPAGCGGGEAAGIPGLDHGSHAGVARVVVDLGRPLAEQVIGAGHQRAVARPGAESAGQRSARQRRVARVQRLAHRRIDLGVGQLAGVQMDLAAQSGLVPAHPGVEDRHGHVRVSAGHLPGPRGVEARDLRLARPGDAIRAVGGQLTGVSRIGVTGAGGAAGGREAEQVKALVVEVGVRRGGVQRVGL